MTASNVKQKIIYISPDLAEQIRQIAFDMRISESELIRRAIIEWLEKNGGKENE